MNNLIVQEYDNSFYCRPDKAYNGNHLDALPQAFGYFIQLEIINVYQQESTDIQYIIDINKNMIRESRTYQEKIFENPENPYNYTVA